MALIALADLSGCRLGAKSDGDESADEPAGEEAGESTATSTATSAEIDPTGDFVETIGTYLVDVDNGRARCDWEGGGAEVDIACAAVVKLPDGREVEADGIKEGASLEWPGPVTLAGKIEVIACETKRQGLEFDCRVKVTDPMVAAKIRFDLAITEADRERVDSTVVTLNYRVGVVAGYVPLVPVTYLPALADPVAASLNWLAEAEPTTPEPRGFQPTAIPAAEFNAEDGVDGLCSRGETLYFFYNDRVYRLRDEMVELYAGSASYRAAGSPVEVGGRLIAEFFQITDLVCTKDAVFVSTKAGIYRIGDDDLVSPVAKPKRPADMPLQSWGSVRHVAIDPAGTIYFATAYDVWRVDDKTEYSHVAIEASAARDATGKALRIRDLAILPGGRLALTHSKRNVVRIVAPDGSFSELALPGGETSPVMSRGGDDHLYVLSLLPEPAGTDPLDPQAYGVNRVYRMSADDGLEVVVKGATLDASHDSFTVLADGTQAFTLLDGRLLLRKGTTSKYLFARPRQVCETAGEAQLVSLADVDRLVVQSGQLWAASTAWEKLYRVDETDGAWSVKLVASELDKDGCGPSHADLDFWWSHGFDIDADGTLFSVDYFTTSLVKIAPDGDTETLLMGTPGAEETGTDPDDVDFPIIDVIDLELPRLAPDGSVVFVDWIETSTKAIYRLSADGLVSHVGGTVGGAVADGVSAQTALLSPEDLVLTSGGGMLFTEFNSDSVREIDGTGKVRTLAGTVVEGDQGYAGDGGPATEAKLLSPTSLARSNDGTIYFVDQNQKLVRRLTPGDSGYTISTIFGDDEAVDCGSGVTKGVASAADLDRRMQASLGVLCHGMIEDIAVIDTCPGKGGKTRLFILQSFGDFSNVVVAESDCNG